VTVCNQGTLAKSASVMLLLSADDTIEPPSSALPWEPQDLYLGSGDTAVIEPGQCQPLELQGQLWTAAPGGYLGAIVVPYPQPELIEDNNSKAGTFITFTP
jgi:hypothetical protein